MDAVVPQDVRCIAYGQVVWLWSPDAGIKSVGNFLTGDGGKKARSPARARSKP